MAEARYSQFDPRIVSIFEDLIARGVIEPIVG